MYLNGINALNYLQGNHSLASINRKTPTLTFQDMLQRATGRPTAVGNFSPTQVKLQRKTDTDTTKQIDSSLANAQAQLTFAAALAYQQAMMSTGYLTCMPRNNNWASAVNSMMPAQYNAGNLSGYLNYGNYLGFLL